MTNKKVETILIKIKTIKSELIDLGDMRPGSVTKQFYKRGDKKWPYWQISYTHNKKSKTEYLKDEFVEKIEAEVATYKKFKKLIEKLVELNVELSKERLKILKSPSEIKKT
jgi:hypothetical protein